MSAEFSATGKQVLRNAQHFADAASPDIAEALSIILNGEVLLPSGVPDEKADWVPKVVWP